MPAITIRAPPPTSTQYHMSVPVSWTMFSLDVASGSISGRAQNKAIEEKLFTKCMKITAQILWLL